MIDNKDDKISKFNIILRSFKIKANCIDYKQIDNYFFYDLQLFPSCKVKDINKFADEIALAVKALRKPSVKILHDQGIVRLEFVNYRIDPLMLLDYFNNDTPKGELMCLLGQNVGGEKLWMDLALNPHMIVAGTTGSGKSTLLHNIIGNLYNYSDVRLMLMDPKNIEFSPYAKFENAKLKVTYSYNDCLDMLNFCIEQMEARYKLINEVGSAEKLPYIVMIIDEFANLIMQDHDNFFFEQLCYLAQKCRAAHINIILATQRPSVNIINGAIKANFPARISCRVASHFDSKVVLDAVGAENLLGNGDALLRDNFRYLERFQIAYTNAEEICRTYLENNIK